jgi:hypothetical protein
MDHLFLNVSIILFVLKLKHNHLKLQFTSKLFFSLIIEAIQYALFLKGCNWACLQIHPEFQNEFFHN